MPDTATGNFSGRGFDKLSSKIMRLCGPGSSLTGGRQSTSRLLKKDFSQPWSLYMVAVIFSPGPGLSING